MEQDIAEVLQANVHRNVELIEHLLVQMNLAPVECIHLLSECGSDIEKFILEGFTIEDAVFRAKNVNI